jgi:hypothetical protein
MIKKANHEFSLRAMMLFLAAFALSCAPEQLPDDENNNGNDDPGNVETPVNPDDNEEAIPDGVVRLYLNDASVPACHLSFFDQRVYTGSAHSDPTDQCISGIMYKSAA